MRYVMLTRVGAAVALASFAFAAAAPASAAAPNPCSVDTFSVDGAVLTVRVCDVGQVPAAAPSAKRAVASAGVLQETLSVDGRAPLVRTLRYERAYEETTHALDDVPLQALGIARTLHVVLAVRGGSARLEHALLVPGAVSLK